MLTVVTIAVSPTLAAEVTPERLVNADREPQNWLMNHRTYNGQRFSPLARINRDNVKNLKLAFAVPIGGQLGNGAIEATPLAEDGFLYITDNSGVLYKIDARSGDAGRIVWTMGSQAGDAAAKSRRCVMGQPRHLTRQPPGPCCRHR
jgi:alcohol dehydrogenase (cytochrome c)